MASSKSGQKASRAPKSGRRRAARPGTELVVITGMSGSGKGSVLKVFEDLGFYAVDNLPVDLISSFADLVQQSREIQKAALVLDVREGAGLEKLPAILKEVKKRVPTRVLFLEACDEVLQRRFSETRRPHPMGNHAPVKASILAERKRINPIAALADETIDTSKFNVHELRAHIEKRFHREEKRRHIMVSTVSFGFRNGVPEDADLVFDVRFLPNPHFIPEFRPLTGKDKKVAKYVRSFPQTQQFIDKTVEMLKFLLPHYIHEGKSYLTIAFGCTGGQHRSVMMTEELAKLLRKAGYDVKAIHRDCPR
jgi:UPF0042 nucleotide-binding protein